MSTGAIIAGGGLLLVALAASRHNAKPTDTYRRVGGGPLRAFDTARLGRRGIFEYVVVYTPGQADNKAFSLLGYPIGGNPSDPASNWGSFDTPEAAEFAAIDRIDASSPADAPPQVAAVVPPLQPGEESRLIRDGNDGVFAWDVYYVDDGPQPWVIQLGLIGKPKIVVGTAASSDQSLAVVEEIITTHKSSLGA